jgi:hypothetical protein
LHDNLSKHTYPCIDLNQVSDSGWLASAARLVAEVRLPALDFKFNHYNLAWHNLRAPNEVFRLPETPCHPHWRCSESLSAAAARPEFHMTFFCLNFGLNFRE